MFKIKLRNPTLFYRLKTHKTLNLLNKLNRFSESSPTKFGSYFPLCLYTDPKEYRLLNIFRMIDDKVFSHWKCKNPSTLYVPDV